MRVWQQRLAIALAGFTMVAHLGPAAGMRATPVFAGVTSFLVALGAGGDAEARGGGARGASSGGYSRPSGSSVRAPSLFGNSPSSSGGYSRPSGSSVRTPPLSARDRDASRAESRRALGDYQRRQNSPQQSVSTPLPRSGDTALSAPSAGQYAPARSGAILPPSYQGPARFGLLEAGMMFMLLNSLTRPSHAEFFHHHAQDPDYLAWRAEADRLAQTDPGLKTKLAQVDQVIAKQADQPRDPAFMPAKSDPEKTDGATGGNLLWWGILGGVSFWLFFRWRKARTGAASAKSGVGAGELHKTMMANQAGGNVYRPEYLRLGMSMSLDPSPFILLGPQSPVPPPEKGGNIVSVTALSAIAPSTQEIGGEIGGKADLFWLAAGRGRFVEVSLSSRGQLESARYFAKIDEVYPADADEWDFWLAPEDGMIGWPEFQTKNGALYHRHWLPGERRVPPRLLTERRERTDGVSERRLQAMLYARGTDLASPAPEVEYLLILAAETPDEAWVELYLGIDLPPSSLGFA